MKIRVGFGFDVHQLVEGRELWLGGIRLEHSKGLLGHSDADVLLHTVCDASVSYTHLASYLAAVHYTNVEIADRQQVMNGASDASPKQNRKRCV